jgi:hypothetical protein
MTALLGFFEFGSKGDMAHSDTDDHNKNPVVMTGIYADNCATCLNSMNVSAVSGIERIDCHIAQTVRAPTNENTSAALATCASVCSKPDNHGIGLDKPFN